MRGTRDPRHHRRRDDLQTAGRALLVICAVHTCDPGLPEPPRYWQSRLRPHTTQYQVLIYHILSRPQVQARQPQTRSKEQEPRINTEESRRLSCHIHTAVHKAEVMGCPDELQSGGFSAARVLGAARLGCRGLCLARKQRERQLSPHSWVSLPHVLPGQPGLLPGGDRRGTRQNERKRRVNNHDSGHRSTDTKARQALMLLPNRFHLTVPKQTHTSTRVTLAPSRVDVSLRDGAATTHARRLASREDRQPGLLRPLGDTARLLLKPRARRSALVSRNERPARTVRYKQSRRRELTKNSHWLGSEGGLMAH